MNEKLIRELQALLGTEHVLHSEHELRLYEYDGSIETARPEAVVFPGDTADVVRIVKFANRHDIPLIGRGAGTGLSGGALARHGGIIVAFTRMNRILEIDAENQCAVVQPGVVNSDVSLAAAPFGLHFAPDPSSQRACTIGGNISENAGGPHTLAYGVTANHVLGLELVLPEGGIVRTGGNAPMVPGYDLTGLLVGSEGTLGIVTEATLRLTRSPEAVETLLAIFDTVDDATQSVVDITARGITPAACEMLDGWTLRAVETWAHAGYPMDSAAVLLLEVDGLLEAVGPEAEAITDVCRANRAREVRRASNARERELLWKGRKNAFGAVGRLSPTYYVQDGVIPRTKLPETLRRIAEIGREHGFEIGNIFHAGDGNLHPIILFDARKSGDRERAIAAADRIIEHCVSVGGVITGEHGVGMEKDRLMPLLFSDVEIALMSRVRDAFNPRHLLNPGKIFPTGKGCGEIRVRPSHQVTRSSLHSSAGFGSSSGRV
jgi:glycolate oxidase